MRRAAGAFALAHVVLFVAASALTGQPTVHEGQRGIEHSFNDGPLSRLFAAEYLLVLGFLAALPVIVFLASHLGRSSEAGRWAARTAAAAGLGYVLLVVGTGLPAGTAALWALDRGTDLETVLALNNVRNFAYFLALPLAGTFALATGLAALADRTMTRWVGWGGVGVGVALLLAVPVAALGIQFGMPLLLVWWTGLAVLLLRALPADRRQ